MLRVILAVSFLMIAMPARAERCFNECGNVCWFDHNYSRWCQWRCVRRCIPAPPRNYSPPQGQYYPFIESKPPNTVRANGNDPGGALLFMFLLFGIAAAIFKAAASSTANIDATEETEETVTIEDLTERINAAAREADAYIARTLAEAQRDISDDDKK